MAKKGKNTTKKKTNNTSNKVIAEVKEEPEILNKIIIALCVLCFLGLFYLLAIYITNKNSDSSSKKEQASSEVKDYSNIIFGESLNRNEKEYLVIYYDKSNEDVESEISDSISSYKAKDEHLTIYTVDMSNMFNKGYVTNDETNKNPQSIDDIKINGTTVIKVSDGKIVEYTEGTDSVKDYLG